MNEWSKEIVIRKNMGTKLPPSYPNEMLVKLMSSKKYSNITHKLFDQKLMVCELGCFSGNNLRFFLDKNDHVHGVELNTEMINLCKENLVRMGYEVPDLKIGSNLNIPYENDYFDLFYTINTLHYSYGEDTLKAIEEYARVVKEGGCVVIETVTPEHYPVKDSIRHEVLKREWNFGGFRDGSFLGVFDNNQHFKETLQLYFDKVEVHSRSEITENTKSEWFIGVCTK
jgi:SAM-dependent methyltransferase